KKPRRSRGRTVMNSAENILGEFGSGRIELSDSGYRRYFCRTGLKKQARTEGNMAGNYLTRLLEMVNAGLLKPEPGTFSELIVKHDDDCCFLKGSSCDCEPELELVQVKPNLPNGFETQSRKN